MGLAVVIADDEPETGVLAGGAAPAQFPKRAAGLRDLINVNH
jgi:hypothetical protein